LCPPPMTIASNCSAIKHSLASGWPHAATTVSDAPLVVVSPRTAPAVVGFDYGPTTTEAATPSHFSLSYFALLHPS